MGHCMPAKTGQSRAGRAEGGGQLCPPGQPGEGGKTRREKPANKPCGWVGWGALASPDARKSGWGDEARHRVQAVSWGGSPQILRQNLDIDSRLPALLVSACLGRGAEATDLGGRGSLRWGPLPPGGSLGLLKGTHGGGGLRSRHPTPLHAGRAQQSAQGWAGPWPAGRRGGWTEAGAPPTPFLASRHCGGQSPGRRPPPARPPVAPQLPNAKFSREKNQSSWQRSGQWWPSGRSGSHARSRGVPATHAVPLPSSEGPAQNQASES